MIKRLKQILNLSEDPDPYERVQRTITELDTAITKISSQEEKITLQQQQIQHRLKHYFEQYKIKKNQTSKSFLTGNNSTSDHLHEQTKLIGKQTLHYKNLFAAISATQQNIIAKKNEFIFLRDQLKSKIAMGQAQVDATQLDADLSEQFMRLEQSGELNQYDQLIEDARCKSQAIEEIQGNQKVFDDFIDQNTSTDLSTLDSEIKNHQRQRLQESIQAQQSLFNRTFEPQLSSETSHRQSQQENVLEDFKESELLTLNNELHFDAFMGLKCSDSEPEERLQRVKDFFDESEQTDSQSNSKEEVINQFFHNK